MALENAKLALLTNFTALRGREDLSDVTIHCGSYSHRAHHFVCCLHSPVLDKLCAEAKATAEAEAKAKAEAKAETIADANTAAEAEHSSPPEITLDVDMYGEDSVERMISFLYTCDYEEKFDYDEWEDPELRMCVHARMSFLAHHMAMDALKALAMEKFEVHGIIETHRNVGD
ncbi:uncharacterized protein MYCFIDRAFT_199365 [Pseudocercospora fijiensis CIRAD86]|uniref:BTB domain-containing protein n=1 Tax=Pseudocercospora fijiensis (strain CIRAD86) TaxID=383855 RepID=M3AQG8_PSEFD|nr:uncharacterized protein MYCFIDRAFT_199365 [Pseudocercospora fijiensis CIRAD86]EME79672.1 hypothetical protein MYCFIDRAFT_199365 [Pseudocercospora fijiensis CIRAD86]